MADSLKEAAYRHAWDEARGLLAETPEKEVFSQHANILGVLTGLFEPAQEKAVMERVLADTSLVPATYYFSFYLHRALQEAGMGGRYLPPLDPWRRMLAKGLTTFAEDPPPTRSDSHAWSAHPMYNFLAILCGIEPASPGFETVRIAPSLGALEGVEGSIPHPQGTLAVHFERQGEEGIQGTITLPEGLTGTFMWNRREVSLHGGTQEVSL